MRALAAGLWAIGLVAAPLAHASSPENRGAGVAECLAAAAHLHRLPVGVLLILLEVEGGSLGQVNHNANGTVDIGPMQVNQLWLPKIATHWHTTPKLAYRALRDSFCANVEGGSWILRQALDAAHGDFWEGVGFYHSHDPSRKAAYLRKVLAGALKLQRQAVNSSAGG